MTSPYKFYQFFINADDRDVGRYLRYFTMLDRDTIESLDAATVAHPEQREAHLALARDVTTRVHGADVLRAAEEASRVLFGGADPRSLAADTFDVLRAEIPTFALPGAGDGLSSQDVVNAVTVGESALFKSRGDARRMIEQGGVYLNGERIGAESRPVDLLHGRYVLVRKGSKTFGLAEAG